MSNKTRQTSLHMFFGDKNQGPSQRVNQTETVEDTPPDQASPIATKLIHKRRNFQDSWLKDFTWLEYNKESDVASCIICSNVAHKTDVTPPTHIRQIFNAPFKVESFKYHGKSALHIKFAKIWTAQKNPESTPTRLCVKKMEREMFQQMCVVFNSAYYIAKTNKPFSDIKELLNYTRKLGVHVLKQYSNDKRCAEFVKFIAEKIRNDIVAEVKSSSFFSVLLAGSTDKSTTEQLIMYMKYCKDGCIKETFLSIVPLQIGTGQGYFDALQEELLKYGLHWRNGEQLVGLGTDGAASMLGSVNGLAAKVKRDVKHLISVHRVAHKLQLCVLKSVKDATYISKVDDVLIGLFKFYGSSPKRQNELEKVATSLSATIFKVKHINQIRWVASKIGALKSLVADWKSCVVHMESIVQSGNTVESNQCKGFLKMLQKFRFLVTVHFLLDFLPIFKKLSLFFQRESLLLSNVKLHVEQALFSLEKLGHTVGEVEKTFLDNTSMSGKFQEVELSDLPQGKLEYEQDRNALIKAGIKCLNERFLDNRCEVYSACSIFDTVSWPSGSDLIHYGDSEMKLLTSHFHHLISEDPLANVTEAIISEWYEIKVLCKHLKLEDILKSTQFHKDRFPLFVKLLSIIAVLPTSTASCERGFSVMNSIKSQKMSKLQTSSLYDLLTISINGPPIDLFQPDCAIDNWYFSSKMRHVMGHASSAT
ncbi:hypothetical protein FKM82_008120 [Ascaphus truei]